MRHLDGELREIRLGQQVAFLIRLVGHQFFTTTQPYLQAAVYRHRWAYRRAVPPELAEL